MEEHTCIPSHMCILLIRIDLPSNLFECSPGDRRKGLLFRNEKPPKDLKHTSWWRTVSITCMQEHVFLLSSFLVRLVRLTCDFPTRRSPPLLLHHSSVRSIEVYACMLIVSIRTSLYLLVGPLYVAFPILTILNTFSYQNSLRARRTNLSR